MIYTSEEKDIIIEKLKSSLVESVRRGFANAMPEVSLSEEVTELLVAESFSNLDKELEGQILELRNKN